MKRRQKKRPVTLIEIMIVILLIGLIGGALAFNMRGSMDKGRAFKTEQNILRIQDALMMEHARGEKELTDLVDDIDNVLEACPFIKNVPNLLKDGWGKDFTFKINEAGDDVTITSSKLDQWKEKHEYK